MNYQQYKSLMLGKRVDYDGAFKYQCVDLIRDYAHRCHDNNQPVRGNAIDLFKETAYWQAIKNDPKNSQQVPAQGDIVIFDRTFSNLFGHVGIVDSASTIDNYIMVLDQNAGGKGDGTGNSAIRVHKYYYAGGNGIGKVVGWLTPKIFSQQATTSEIEWVNPELGKLYMGAKHNNDWDYILGTIIDRDSEIAELAGTLPRQALLHGSNMMKRYIEVQNANDWNMILNYLNGRDLEIKNLRK